MPKVVSACELTLGERPSRNRLLAWLHSELRSAILDGRLRAGTRMPATRDFGQQYNISRGSVVAVYQQLESEGLLVSKGGAGTWVMSTQRSADAGRSSPAKPALSAPRLAGLMWTHPPKPFQYGPAVSEFPISVWSRITSRRMRSASSQLLTGWGDGRGYAPLCSVLASHLGSVRGVNCDPQQVIIVSGVQQALDLLARFILKAGDAVWMEDPGYFGAIDAFASAGASLVPVPVDQNGLDVSAAKKLAPRARAAYLTPTHQFPLGVALSHERRIALLEWAREAGAYLIEDDYDSELRFTVPATPTLQHLDRWGRVIVVGTFNKIMFPAIRLGYIILPTALVDAFLKFRYRADMHPVGLDQSVMCDFIEGGHLARHMRRMRELYALRLDALETGAKRYLKGLIEIPSVRAGLCTTGFLRNGMSSDAAEKAAAAHGVITQSLHRHTIKREDMRGLLLGFAAFPEKSISEGIEKLARALGN